MPVETEPVLKPYGLRINLDKGLHKAWKAECLIQNITMEAGVLDSLALWINSCAEGRRKKKGGGTKKTNFF